MLGEVYFTNLLQFIDLQHLLTAEVDDATLNINSAQLYV